MKGLPQKKKKQFFVNGMLTRTYTLTTFKPMGGYILVYTHSRMPYLSMVNAEVNPF